MKTALGFLTEEDRTRSKNAARRMSAYAVVMLLFAGAGGYAIHRYLVTTQNKAQFEEHYGRGAATMLSAPHMKILFRCNEPEPARWVAEMIGEEEKERPRIGTTATVQSNGRDSINYSTITERRFVVSKEEIMALPNLSGYWKYSDSVVRFHIQSVDRRRVALALMQRNAQSITEPEKPSPPIIEQPAEQQLALPIGEIRSDFFAVVGRLPATTRWREKLS